MHMDSNITTLALYGLGGVAAIAAAAKAKTRFELSRAKHASLTGHVRMSRRMAALIPFYEFGPDRAFAVDGAPADVVERRKLAFEGLAAHYQSRFPKTIALKAEAKTGISDLQFTDAYRVPFQFSRLVQDNLGASTFVVSSRGVMLSDIDGNRYFDVAGSYGVNVFGYDAYKATLAEGYEQAADLGPVLGAYHPVVAFNVARLREISGLDEISFHMSGTEAVMQAVRLARYHTGRNRIVRFSGAYHGWWGDVQPGIGNPARARDTFTLAEMSEATLGVLRKRRDIACVLINPIQAMHPNAGPPADSALVDSSRSASFDRVAYTKWLQALREVCTARGIVLILDDVFMGFRLAAGGSQEYFGIRADMVTYGKTLGGGLPVGVLCGRRELMKRYRDDRPADICFARGTFNAHPYVMGAMAAFLKRIATPEWQALYRNLDAVWTARAEALNRRLNELNLPVQVANMSTVWSVNYTRPSRYNWMLQYYLRRYGLLLSWVGTGRLIFSLNYVEAEYEEVSERFIGAAKAMEADGWWWHDPQSQFAKIPIKRRILREMLELGVLRRDRA